MEVVAQIHQKLIPQIRIRDSYLKMYKSTLKVCLRMRLIVIAAVVILLFVAIQAFGTLKDSFFPDSTSTQFFVHYWLPEGTDIRTTSKDMHEIEEHLLEKEPITSVATFVGSGAPRFIFNLQP